MLFLILDSRSAITHNNPLLHPSNISKLTFPCYTNYFLDFVYYAASESPKFVLKILQWL